MRQGILRQIIKKDIMINKHKGTATIEATLAMPIFIFAMIALYHMGMCKLAESKIYEAAVECSEYVAEQAYIKEECLVTPAIVLRRYIDDKDLIEAYIKNGCSGISFLGSYIDGEHMLHLKVSYTTNINVPFIKNLEKIKTYEIQQRCYVGFDKIYGTDNETKDKYVFVTENMDVYHVSRSCTHLALSKKTVSYKNAVARKYTACEFCAKGKGKKDFVIVTEQGEKYHYNSACSGLKRTVKRVRLSSIPGVGGCSRCTK